MTDQFGQTKYNKNRANGSLEEGDAIYFFRSSSNKIMIQSNQVDT